MTNGGEISSSRRNKRLNDETQFRRLAWRWVFFYSFLLLFYLNLITAMYDYWQLQLSRSTDLGTTQHHHCHYDDKGREREGIGWIQGQKGANDETVPPGELFLYMFFTILLIILTTRLCTMMIAWHQHNTPPSSLVGLYLPTLQYDGLETCFYTSRVPYTNRPKRRIFSDLDFDF